jgi:hypothetical protein
MSVEQQLAAILGQLRALARPALETAVSLAQITALGNLLIGVSCAAAAVACVFRIRACMRAWEHKYVDYDVPVYVLLGLGALTGALMALVALLDIWNWVGLFNPELYLAHRVLERVL